MELENLAAKLGIEVRRERLLYGRSGLCRLRDTHLLFVEKTLREKEEVQVFIAALSRFPLDTVQTVPEVRRLLEEHRAGKQG